MSYQTLFFDLDDTLYSSDNGLWQAIRNRMGQYMVERLGLPETEVPQLRRHYFETYGTTLRGLQKHHQVDADDYLAFVHDLPLNEFIKPNPDLRKLILSLPQKRFIFTNADVNHARRVIKILNVEDGFEAIIDVRAIEFACKPEPTAYQRALALAGNPPASACVLIDDSTTNLATAYQLGFTTVLVSLKGEANPSANYSIQSILELPQVMPELWNGSPQRTV